MADGCRRWKRGFEAAEAALRAEKIEWLTRMSAAESRRVYDGLCGLYYARGAAAANRTEDPAKLAQVRVRRRLNLMALSLGKKTEDRIQETEENRPTKGEKHGKGENI